MGLVASQHRLINLVARKNNLEFVGQQINQERTSLAYQESNLFTSNTNLTPNSDDSLRIQSKISALQAQDKTLELQLRNIDTQQQAVSTELQSLNKVIEKSIEFIYKGLA